MVLKRWQFPNINNNRITESISYIYRFDLTWTKSGTRMGMTEWNEGMGRRSDVVVNEYYQKKYKEPFKTRSQNSFCCSWIDWVSLPFCNFMWPLTLELTELKLPLKEPSIEVLLILSIPSLPLSFHLYIHSFTSFSHCVSLCHCAPLSHSFSWRLGNGSRFAPLRSATLRCNGILVYFVPIFIITFSWA